MQRDLTRSSVTQVLPCSIRHVHDWSSCNFTHPGEKARRRDPQAYSYTGIACPDMKKVSNFVRLCFGEKSKIIFKLSFIVTRSECNGG